MLARTPKKLTDEWVAATPYAAGRPIVIPDPALPGHRLVIRKRTKTFEIQREKMVGGKRRTHVVKTGRAPMDKIAEARERAVAIMGKIDRGENPRSPEKRDINSVTFAEAWLEYEQHLIHNASPATLTAFRRCAEILRPIHNMSLVVLSDDPSIAKREHERISKKVRVGDSNAFTGGKVIAGMCMRFMNAMYHNVRKNKWRRLPLHPPSSVKPSKDKRDLPSLSSDDLPAWFAQRQALQNPIYRELVLFMVLSGLRRTDAGTMRWEDLDLKRRVFHRPHPKGREGNRPAFDLPLSDAMVRCLWRARKDGRALYPNSPWVWPADSAAGHATVVKSRKLSRSGHDLRRSYATFATEVGIPEENLARLLNHSLGKNITRTYAQNSPLLKPLIRMQERISRHIIETGVPDPERRRGMARRGNFTDR
jgi:integrase